MGGVLRVHSPAPSCTTRRPAPGRRPAVSPRRATATPPRCCPTARCWWRGDGLSAAALASAELYDPATGTWTRHRQSRRSALRPHRDAAAQRQGAGGGGIGCDSGCLPAPSCTTRRRERGRCHRQPDHGALRSHGDAAAQRQGAGGGRRLVRRRLPAPSCTTRPPGCWSATGQPGHGARNLTRPRCCPTARCWWREDGVLAVLLPAPSCTTRRPDSWSATGSLATARDIHTATLLPNGKVLVAGGPSGCGGDSASAELYDPATGTWTRHGQPRHGARLPHRHAAAQRQGAGGGGTGRRATVLASAELYDPATGPGAPPAASPRHARPHGDAAAQRQGAGGGGMRAAGRIPCQRRAVRPGQRDLDRHGQSGHGAQRPHRDAAAQRQGAGGGGMGGGSYLASAELYDPAHRDLDATGSSSPRRATTTPPRCCPTARCWWRGDSTVRACSCQRRAVRPGHRHLDGDRQSCHGARLPHRHAAAQRQGAGGGGRRWRTRSPAPSCTTRPAMHWSSGGSLAARTPAIPPRCCPMEGCWWPEERRLHCSAELYW